MTIFVTWPFKSTGSTVARTMPARLAETVNVKEYGAVGDGSHDDTSNIQAAFDAAFGSSSSPHAGANSTLNRPVFFPNGNYIVSSPLNLTRVVGGHIYGAGQGATVITGTAAAGTVLAINGAVNLVVERMQFNAHDITTYICIDLDWNGTTGGDSAVGLSGNTFRDVGASQALIGIRIAHSNAGGGDSNLFQRVIFGSDATGIDAQAATAVNNVCYQCGANGNAITYIYNNSAGQIHVYEPSNENTTNPGTSSYDFNIASGFPVMVAGGRSEGRKVFNVSSGLLRVSNFLHSYADTFGAGEFITMSGGTAILDACARQSGANSSLVNGSAGSLYLRGNALGSHAGFSGTLVENI